MDTSSLYRRRNKSLLVPFIIVFCVILLIVISLYVVYFKKISIIFDEDASLHLDDVSMQSVHLVEERIKSNLLALEQISSVFYNSENLFSDVIFEYLKKKVASVGAIRLDLVLPDGSAVVVTRDGHVVSGFNLKGRNYFHKSLAGEDAVEFLHESRVDQQEIFVCSVPVKQKDGIAGVLLGVYDLASLEHLLSLDGSDEDGFSFLVSEDGSIITGRNIPSLYPFGSNLFRSLGPQHFYNGRSLSDLQEDIKNSDSGVMKMQIGGNSYHAAYRPMSFNGCYLFTMIPSVVLTKVSTEFVQLTVLLAIVEVVFVFGLGIFFALLYRNNRRKLYELAFNDSITGGGNNVWFMYEAKSILQEKPEDCYALVILDIDNLKILNDTYGYDAGNRVLWYVYNHIKSILVSGEIAARAMQDDFVLLLKYHSDDILSERLNLLVDKMNTQNLSSLVADDKYVVSMTAGIYAIEDVSLDMLSIQDRAYIALNTAKKMQGSLMRCAFFHEQDRLRLHEEKRIENRMEEALANGEFVVYVQPKYDITTNTVSGAEALVRWFDPEKGMISPDKFIPLFERNGFIFKLDLYVFEQVCKMLRSEIDRGLEPHTVSVNLSRAYLNRIDFLENFKSICTQYNIPSKYLELELTETIIFENMDLLIQVIGDMHSFGFTCSLDDFGSGYSSLNILKSVPVDVLKLDRGFFSDPENASSRGTSVIESVINLAQKLKMKTVSEGVEQEWQVDLLRKAKCDMVQGFVYSRPVPISDYEKMAFGKAE